MRRTLTTAAALLLSAASLAQAQDIKPEAYTYGTPLDIASVMSIHIKPTVYCTVTDAVMTYRDSAGEIRKLSYRTLSESCRHQN